MREHGVKKSPGLLCFNELPPNLKNPGTFHLQFALGCVFALPCSQFAVHYPDRRSSLGMFVVEFIRNLHFRLCSSAWGRWSRGARAGLAVQGINLALCPCSVLSAAAAEGQGSPSGVGLDLSIVPEPHQSLDHQKKIHFKAGINGQLSVWCQVLAASPAQPCILGPFALTPVQLQGLAKGIHTKTWVSPSETTMPNI